MSKRVRESVLAEKKGRLLRTKAEMRRSSANLTPLSAGLKDVDDALFALKEVPPPAPVQPEIKPFVPPLPASSRPLSPPRMEAASAPLRAESPKTEPPKPAAKTPPGPPVLSGPPVSAFPKTAVVQSPMDVFLSAPVAPAPVPASVPAPPPPMELSSSTPPLGFLSKETVDKVSRAVVLEPVVPAGLAAAPQNEVIEQGAQPLVEAAAPHEQPVSELAAADDLEGDFFQSEAGAQGAHGDHAFGGEEEAPHSAGGSETDSMYEEGSGDEEPEAAFARQDAERSARMRKIVMGVVAFVGVLAVAGIVKSLVGASGSSSTVKPSATVPLSAAPGVSASAVAAPVMSAAPAMSAAPVAPAESASAKPAESASAPAEAAVDPAKAAQLEKEALSLLNRGKLKDAIEKAREAIAADPSQAMPYLYLGSALQDSGKWKDGIEAYSECVRKATKGPVHECRAAGGRK